jgi:hypothetical protein
MADPIQPYGPRPTHVGNEKYLADCWIIEAVGLDVALKLATDGSKACEWKVEARRNAAEAAGRAYRRRRCPAMASTRRIITTGVPESLQRHPGGGVGTIALEESSADVRKRTAYRYPCPRGTCVTRGTSGATLVRRS